MYFYSDERTLAAYQVGCSNVPLTRPYDIMDIPNYDFSSDVIARAQYFHHHLFHEECDRSDDSNDC